MPKPPMEPRAPRPAEPRALRASQARLPVSLSVPVPVCVCVSLSLSLSFFHVRYDISHITCLRNYGMYCSASVARERGVHGFHVI